MFQALPDTTFMYDSGVESARESMLGTLCNGLWPLMPVTGAKEVALSIRYCFAPVVFGALDPYPSYFALYSKDIWNIIVYTKRRDQSWVGFVATYLNYG